MTELEIIAEQLQIIKALLEIVQEYSKPKIFMCDETETAYIPSRNK